MIPRVAALQHRILRRGALHIAAGQIVERHIKLCSEQFLITRANTAPTPSCGGSVVPAIERAIIDTSLRDRQQIVQRGCGTPALLDRRVADRRPVGREPAPAPQATAATARRSASGERPQSAGNHFVDSAQRRRAHNLPKPSCN